VVHLTARGSERQAIFRDDQDRKRFLSWIDESADIYHWRVFVGSCLWGVLPKSPGST
jgi:hypothetical protein